MMKTIKQASEETGLSQYAIRQLILSNKIKYIRCGVKYMVNIVSFFDMSFTSQIIFSAIFLTSWKNGLGSSLFTG
ncbi:MAG: hypothetical protein IJ719_14300 [Clostridia bacterium]|nr:hypothetical protein [Clostridia bacterium]